MDFWGEERSYTHSASWEVYDSTPSEGGVFANNDIDMPVWFNRGYTGHACPELGRREHLQEFDLINMNGRLYDPIPGRMLSADNYIQQPGNSQSYNRYAYVFNNPMKYTDPSGEIGILAALGVAAIVAGVSYLINAGKNGWEMDPRKWTSGDAVGLIRMRQWKVNGPIRVWLSDPYYGRVRSYWTNMVHKSNFEGAYLLKIY